MRSLALAIALTLPQEPPPEELKPFPIETKLAGASTRPLFGFVDTPANFESRLKTFADEKRPREVVTVPGTGEATLYLLWGAYRPRFGGPVSVAIDHRERIIRAHVPGTTKLSDRFDPPDKDQVHGRGVRLGSLEQGGWTVMIIEGSAWPVEERLDKDKKSTTVLKFLAGPGGPKPEGRPLERKGESELPSFLTWPGSTDQHDCVAFVSRESEFEGARGAALGEKGASGPAPFKSNEEVVLYVLWGRRIAWPDATAVFDAASKRFLVSTRWIGGAGMKEILDSPYAGYGFRLGILKPGEYAVEVSELIPAKSEKPTVTLTIAFRVEPQ